MCVNKGPVSAHQYTPVRDERRRARPSAHGITAAPAPAFHVPMVSARVVLKYTYTYECWRAAAGIAQRELLTCGTGPAASVCCQRWLGGLLSAVRWRRPGGQPGFGSCYLVPSECGRARGSARWAARARSAGKMPGWMPGRDRLPELCWWPWPRTPTKHCMKVGGAEGEAQFSYSSMEAVRTVSCMDVCVWLFVHMQHHLEGSKRTSVIVDAAPAVLRLHWVTFLKFTR